MKLPTFGWFLAIACVVLLGCATAPPSVDVTGAWAGTYTWPYGVSPISMTLRQTSAEVTGELLVTGTLGEVRQANGPSAEPSAVTRCRLFSRAVTQTCS